MDDTPVSAEASAPDLVERLRKAKPDEHCNDSLCAEAGDTITAITAEVERLMDMWSKDKICGLELLRQNKTLTAEVEQNAIDLEEYRRDVERLRVALRGAYEVYAGSDGFIPETAAEGYQQQIIKQMVDCISAALNEEPRT